MAPPLPLSAVYQLLPIASVVWDIQRNDHFSGLGSGDVWQAELADPFWSADVTFGRGLNDELKQVAAAIRDLEGAQQAFMLCDPLSPFPQADPDGSLLGTSHITVRAVAEDRRQLLLQGFPEGYQLTRGDKIEIAWDAAAPGLPQPWVLADGVWNDLGFLHHRPWTISSTPSSLVRRFVEVSRPVRANLLGQMDVRVFPRLPLSLPAGVTVNLINPACPVIVQPGSHKPGTARRSVTEGAGVKVLQKRRS